MRAIVNFLIVFFIALLISSSMQAQQKNDTLILHFAFNRYNPRPEEAGRLRQFLHDHSLKTDSLYIIGFTDTVGTEAYNMRLSLYRAERVADIVKRFTPAPFSSCAKGKEEPVAGDDSLSRRVVIIRSKVSHAAGIHRIVGTGQSSGTPALHSPLDTVALLDHQPDTVISLSDINFIEDSPNLTPASRMTLPAYIQFLKRYKADFLEIDGYCNSATPITSTTDPLFILSVKRAKLIFDFLVDDGFDPTRLSYKGMGNAKARNANPVTNDEARANMRVEVRVFRKPLQ